MPNPLFYIEALKAAHRVSPEALKKAYYDAAIKLHPDLNPDNKEAQEAFKSITQTYSELSDLKFKNLQQKDIKKSISVFKKVFGTIFNIAFPDKGAHLIYNLQISPLEAKQGAKKTITYIRPLYNGKSERIQTTFQIPPKVLNRNRLKLKKHGVQMQNHERSGDLFIVLHIA